MKVDAGGGFNFRDFARSVSEVFLISVVAGFIGGILAGSVSGVFACEITKSVFRQAMDPYRLIARTALIAGIIFGALSHYCQPHVVCARLGLALLIDSCSIDS